MLINRAPRVWRTITIAIASPLLVTAWEPGGAQAPDADSAVVLKGRTRAILDATAYVEPRRMVTAGGILFPFVTNRWQIGLAPTYWFSPAGGTSPARYHTLQLAGLVNYVVTRTERAAGYVGGYASTTQGC